MPISSRTSGEIRANSRPWGKLFQALALLTFAATIYGTFKVSSLGSEIGIGAIHNPLTWFVFLGGSFAALMLIGIGQTLGILCAIYDRQVTTPEMIGVTTSKPTFPSKEFIQPAKQSSTVWERIVERDVDVPIERLPIDVPPKASDGLWKSLTRERHFTSRENIK
ncbi:MAG TPA: hypothetical protein VIJ40_06780 [Acidimicrobiales bacterium]